MAPFKRPVRIRIALLAPPASVIYGIQRGKGASYEVDFATLHKTGDITFDFAIDVADKNGAPNFSGDCVHGTPDRRFTYVNAGTCAGQKTTPWSRRMIVLLNGITPDQARKALQPGHRLCAVIQGTGDDGGPSCATVPLVGGWKVITG